MNEKKDKNKKYAKVLEYGNTKIITIDTPQKDCVKREIFVIDKKTKTIKYIMHSYRGVNDVNNDFHFELLNTKNLFWANECLFKGENVSKEVLCKCFKNTNDSNSSFLDGLQFWLDKDDYIRTSFKEETTGELIYAKCKSFYSLILYRLAIHIDPECYSTVDDLFHYVLNNAYKIHNNIANKAGLDIDNVLKVIDQKPEKENKVSDEDVMDANALIGNYLTELGFTFTGGSLSVDNQQYNNYILKYTLNGVIVTLDGKTRRIGIININKENLEFLYTNYSLKALRDFYYFNIPDNYYNLQITNYRAYDNYMSVADSIRFADKIAELAKNDIIAPTKELTSYLLNNEFEMVDDIILENGEVWDGYRLSNINVVFQYKKVVITTPYSTDIIDINSELLENVKDILETYFSNTLNIILKNIL